jgi:hypothetical protein
VRVSEYQLLEHQLTLQILHLLIVALSNQFKRLLKKLKWKKCKEKNNKLL